jgi:rSAM/selenodomain-associated transferase 2
MKKISVIIPTLNEIKNIHSCLASVQVLRNHGHEVIVVDGGSRDGTCERITGLVDKVIHHTRGRATQMNAGVRFATGNIFVFLHADTLLPENADVCIISASVGRKSWGRFNIQLSGSHWSFRVIERCMNLRTRLSGIVTSDHAIFVSKDLYEDVGGFPEIALMEDIAISQKLKTKIDPTCLKQKVITSSRRWEENGIIKTVLKMWWLRIMFFIGTDPLVLLRQYE